MDRPGAHELRILGKTDAAAAVVCSRSLPDLPATAATATLGLRWTLGPAATT